MHSSSFEGEVTVVPFPRFGILGEPFMDHPAGIRGGEIAIEESEAGGEAAFDAEVTFHAEFGELGADGAVDEPASSGAVGEGAEDEEDEFR